LDILSLHVDNILEKEVQILNLYQQIKNIKPEDKNIEEKEERQEITRRMATERDIRNRRKNPGR